jgi:hypothetical protein
MKSNVYEPEGTIVAGEESHQRAERRSEAGSAEQAEMLKKMEAAGRPGPAHDALKALVGSWKAEVKCWMDPGGLPEISKGTATARWVLSGRFLEEEFRGEMMGKPFTGRTLMGYDNTKKTFNSVWVCDTQTSMFVSEGKGDSGFKVLTLEGKSTCPATDRKDIPMKTVLRVINPDKHILEMYDGSQGNAKTMEIIYTRE